MKTTQFDEHDVIHKLKHYLPAQAPLKDFVHHNTLHGFQHLPFFDAIRSASAIFGYKSSLSVDEYRQLYSEKKISEKVLDSVLKKQKGNAASEWKNKLLNEPFDSSILPRIGSLRSYWKKLYRTDMDSLVQPLLFRVVCSFLDQGISIWAFPIKDKQFITSLRELEKNGNASFFKSKRARKLFLETKCEISSLLTILVGDEALYEQYLFDQQFSHQGWSGMVAVVEDQPQALLDTKKITLSELITFELLLEIDALDTHFHKAWEPLSAVVKEEIPPLFAEVKTTEQDEVLRLWQEAFEWEYYDQVVKGLQSNPLSEEEQPKQTKVSFQGLFCIDDRECSYRRYLEHYDPDCQTFGTPGFYGIDTFYKPHGGQFVTKVCPAPVTPKHVIKEIGTTEKSLDRDVHFSKHSHSFHSGWLISQTLGFWSAMKLFVNIFRPSISPATAYSFKHMDKVSDLTIEHKHEHEDGLQVGYTLDEMTDRVERVLKSIGLVEQFAPIVYIVGHGASSVNNPHYAAYDCGACSGRAGSVNARAFSYMANHPKVRANLVERGLVIPATTQFVGALRDTTRDEIMFYDEDKLSAENAKQHAKNLVIFNMASDHNAKERSRRFMSIDTHQEASKIHQAILRRSVSLFEPRPELNHATNTLCIVGRRELTKHLFLDRRSFLNSYDYRIDPTGEYLLGILNAAAPVCGGINLEYYFSRVDNQKLGAGTKLPHNVMGLFGVANGIDGDLRPGLPSQMIEVHDPLRLLMVVEHFPDVVLKTIQENKATYEWFGNEWVNLVAIHPETKAVYLFEKGEFSEYKPLTQSLHLVEDIERVVEESHENIEVLLLNN